MRKELPERNTELGLDVILIELGEVTDVGQLFTTNSTAQLSLHDVVSTEVIEELEISNY
jgi:hypothetical protein